MLAAPLLAGSANSAEIELHVTGLRNDRGLVRVCVTAAPAHFPDCRGDDGAIKASIPAAQTRTIRLSPVAPGAYAIAVIHDENANGKLDTMLAIPREGFGFSRDSPVVFGPPSFAQARIETRAGPNRLSIRMRYVL